MTRRIQNAEAISWNSRLKFKIQGFSFLERNVLPNQVKKKKKKKTFSPQLGRLASSADIYWNYWPLFLLKRPRRFLSGK